MPLPFFGPISLDQIQGEYGGTTPTSINEYYRGGGLVPENATTAKIPFSGQISFSQFFASNNTGTLTHVFDDVNNVNLLTNGTGATFIIQNITGASGPWTGNFDVTDKYYTVSFNNPFPNTNYSINITIVDNQSASGVRIGFLNFGAIANKQPGSFDVQFYQNEDPIPSISYVRAFSASCDWLGL